MFIFFLNKLMSFQGMRKGDTVNRKTESESIIFLIFINKR